MALVVATVTNIDFTNSQFIVNGTITTSGTYTTTGDPLDLSTIGVPSSAPPTSVNIFEIAAAAASQSGWNYKFDPGTTQANGKVELFNGTTQFTGAAAYSGTIPTTLYFQAWFPKL